MAASVRITVIGPLTVAVGGRPIELAGFRRRALVARLTVGLGVPVSADDLADDLWEDDPAHRSTATLRTYISKLRSLLGEGGAALVSSSAGYCFDPDLVTLDAAELPAAHAADPATLREVLEGSRGAPYEGLDHLTWARTAAQRIDGWRLAAEERLAELDLAGGRADLVAHRAAPLTERHPYAERLHALVATALYTAGRQHDALAVLRRLRERLRDDLGLDPTPAAADLEHRILHHAVDVPGDATRVLPPPLRPRPGDPALVGRRSELAAIDAAREHLDRTGARVVLVTGDAGIGKTRLAAEAAERALADGALVLYGRCDEHVAVALQPFREALHGLRDTLDTPELATVLPEVEREDSAIGQGEEGRSRAATHGAATVLAASLAELADRRPVVLVLDDLQWATPSTIATVRHLLRHGRDRAVLVLALSRPDPGSQIDMLVAELRRERALDVVPLDGLPVEDVAVLLDREEASDVDPTDARDATGGNPYLLAELARHHRDGGTGIPGSVTAVLAPVIAALDADTRAVLETAALLGVVPDLDTLSVVHGIDGEALATHLERAAATRLLLPGPTGGYMFAHALARDVVDAGIGPARRPHRHAQIAAALVATHGDTRPDDVAAHFRLAGARHTADAATWLARAGEAALARHAYEDGEIRLAEAVGLPGALDDRTRGEALLLLAEARSRLGDAAGAREALDQAASIARRVGDATALARAALWTVPGGRGASAWLADDRRRALLREAHGQAAALPVALRIRVTGELAMAEYLPATRATRRALAEEAIEQALADGSPDAVRAALPASRIAWWHPAHTPSRRAFADRVAASAREAGDPWTEVDALDYARNDALELGDRPGFDAAGERTRALAAELRTPHHRWRAAVCDFHDAMLRGDHDEAEQHAGRALACWEGHDHPDAVLTYGYQIAAVRMQQGRPDDVIAMARSVAAAEPGLLIVRAALARACAAAGQLDAARQELDLAMADDMAGVPQDSGWLLAITWYAETAALTRHAAAARHLLGQLHRWVDHIACIAGPGLSWGTVGHTVAALQAVLGDRDRSDATAARATVVDERVGFVSPSSGLSAVGEVTGEG